MASWSESPHRSRFCKRQRSRSIRIYRDRKSSDVWSSSASQKGPKEKVVSCVNFEKSIPFYNLKKSPWTLTSITCQIGAYVGNAATALLRRSLGIRWDRWIGKTWPSVPPLLRYYSITVLCKFSDHVCRLGNYWLTYITIIKTWVPLSPDRPLGPK
jgi:hypothetical protein